MTTPDANVGTPAVSAGQVGLGAVASPEEPRNDSVVIDLWGSGDTYDTPPRVESKPGEIASPFDLKLELERLTAERERLKEENRKLLTMLECTIIEEEVAALKKEVGDLGGENEKLLAEIQRRRQSIASGTSGSAIPKPGN